MSWLLVGLIPGLLMVATFGLQRLEAGLQRDTVSATDVAKFLEQVGAQTSPQKAPVRASTLPVRNYPPAAVNTEFQRTRHADRV
ncbi:hypothetical protein H7J88_14530 [Mycolicibacterium flavescens]|uniref:Uncharacterized protein n=1 Tax=Mycolicibacterium flavescens TaxID=1776 RepID=A0A1E3RER1_MYCFV|nr:hypothetical protein [Mycolicibacterium flavescens]ODQ88360.1 hypothetical protein BHQ18_19660 [Mycolicibacterium flavescens]